MTTLLAFAVTLGILVVIHEFGHFLVARACGVKVLRFSLGFGPVIAKRLASNGTEWALSAIPLGGYVKMTDEREGEVAAEDLPHAFNRKSVGQRMAIVVAGPLSNLLLAVLLYWALFVAGITVLKPIVAAPTGGTPAALAGFHNGDVVTAIDNDPVADWQDLYWLVLKHGIKNPVMTVETRDAANHIEYRRLDVTGIDLADADHDPLARIGLMRYLPDLPPVVGQVVAGSRAESTGLKPGDRIQTINGQAIVVWEDMVKIVKASPEKPLRLALLRSDKAMTVTLTPAAAHELDRTIGRIGAAPHVDPALFASMQAEIRFGPAAAMKRALVKTWDLSTFSLEMMGRLVIGQASLKNISGPVTIADYAGRSAEAGITAFIAFLALISVSLGVLNLLPIPLLDGGHLLYYFVELITGQPVSDRIQGVGQKIGMALLATLMLFALFNDFHRLLTG
ncbi:MAG: RIP metalloprotease RseP [Hydrogenophilales bacterium CG03_land_8_20_14_0_80_62_28]|nr:RIP metalloprotease RseP [Betaproteobacteria bacterium]OIO77622.1 MAG: RIP metalloprotease RseP [Hydrogenophilaceae bacterium CG1_02_62_390]PIV24453.1 MAG: RIP metalloprotease RseP [Hydrogenophilales bacterium CG03_land_8_20_14_0_80_62_28]PIW37870.1 MAG: RIP metalloprotease RseP [Hydrogenophilales bacterium CG15_BIG_FIL_POST_REV_8_21_14_020_62_31]PIW70863.1 MAG: RIP metalloprotease RseP [Hydrogenophilales bacterium CG12_big_fil_rev_8_21_14_0_65_61_21]PIX01634.1 MAG: RIP metalloprotease RseP